MIIINIVLILVILLLFLYVIKKIYPIKEHIRTGGSQRHALTQKEVTCGTDNHECPERYKQKKDARGYEFIPCKGQTCSDDTCCDKKKYCKDDTSICKDGYLYKKNYKDIECINDECLHSSCCEIPQIEYYEFLNRIPNKEKINVDSAKDFTNDANISKETGKTLQHCKDTCSLGQVLPKCIGFTFDSDKGVCSFYDSIKEHRLVNDTETVDLYVSSPNNTMLTKIPTLCKTVNCPNVNGRIYNKDDTQICKDDVCTVDECCTVPNINYNTYKDMIPFKISPIKVIKTGLASEQKQECQKECNLQQNNVKEERCLGFDFDAKNKECKLYNEIPLHEPGTSKSGIEGYANKQSEHFQFQKKLVTELRPGTCDEARFNKLCTDESNEPGWIIHDEKIKLKHTCNNYECKPNDCCQKTCSSFKNTQCGLNRQLKLEPNSILCKDNECSDQTCCEDIVCDPLTINYSNINIESPTLHGVVPNVECNAGYTLEKKNNENLLCNIGSWNNIPICNEDSCPDDISNNINGIDQPEKHKVEKTDNKPNTEATITCTDKYKSTDPKKLSSNVKCNKGKWSGTPLTCNIKTCSVSDISVGGKRTSAETINYDQDATFECNKGYTLQGEGVSSTKCKGSPIKAPTCNENSCPDNISTNIGSIDSKKHKVEKTDNKPNTEATITCTDKYKSASSKVKCNTGTWSGTAPTCNIKTCSVGVLTNGKRTGLAAGGKINYDQSATFECNTGYTLQGSSSTKCTGSPIGAPTCKIKTCTVGVPTNGTGSRTSAATINYGQDATFTCNTGYRMQEKAGYTISNKGVSSTQCSGSAIVAPTCKIKTCTVGTITNGTRTQNKTGSINYGQDATFTCNTNYTMQEKAGYTISNNGVSSTQCSGSAIVAPTCKIKTCTVGTITNGTGTQNKTGSINYGDMVKYACNDGYTRSGARRRWGARILGHTCDSSSSPITAPTCKAIFPIVNHNPGGGADYIRTGGCNKGEYVVPKCTCGGGPGYPECYNKFCCKKCTVPHGPTWTPEEWKTQFKPHTHYKRDWVIHTHRSTRCPNDPQEVVAKTYANGYQCKPTPGSIYDSGGALWKKRCKDGWMGVYRIPQTEEECGKGLNSGGNKDVCKMI